MPLSQRLSPLWRASASAAALERRRKVSGAFSLWYVVQLFRRFLSAGFRLLGLSVHRFVARMGHAFCEAHRVIQQISRSTCNSPGGRYKIWKRLGAESGTGGAKTGTGAQKLETRCRIWNIFYFSFPDIAHSVCSTSKFPGIIEDRGTQNKEDGG
jgi:hypothetical protein